MLSIANYIIMKILPVAVLSAGISAGIATLTLAQTQQEQPLSETDRFKQKLNANTVTILGGSIDGTYLKLIDDLSRSLGQTDTIRILPIRGDVVTNVRDILYLQGIDMGIMRADVIETFRGKKHYEGIEKRLNYITILHHEEFHLLSSNPKINSVEDLNNKTIALHHETYLSGKLVLEKLGIKPKKLIKSNLLEAAEKTKKGEYDAIMRVTGKPFNDIGKLLQIDSMLKLIPIPFSEKLLDSVYFPTLITSSDYPDFIPESKQIPTIAVHAILGVFNWKPGTERHRRLSKFTNTFFSNYEKILKRRGRHNKWDQINLAAKLSGWKRFQPAKKWLDKARLTQKNSKTKKLAQSKDKEKLLANFRKFLDRKLSKKESDALFSDFKKWRESQ